MKRTNLKKGALILAPFLLFFLACALLGIWGLQYLKTGSAYSSYLKLLTEGIAVTEEASPTEIRVIDPATNEGEVLDGDFPMPSYGVQWATMNVDGFSVRDIPVFYGDGMSILSKGAGMSQFSRFCGQNGKTVLSAHVTSHFFELEDAKERFENGEEVLVTMDTLWGTYVYRVSEAVIFDYRDISSLVSEDGAEILYFYTCYPRVNGYSFKTQRLGLRCELVSGATWRDYVGQAS